MRALRAHVRLQAGVALVELIVAIVLIGVLASVLVPLGATAVRTYQTAQARLTSQDKLRYAVERMARELREVKYDATSGLQFVGAIASNPVSQITFTRHYYDGAGVPSAAANVTLQLSGTDVRMSDSRFPGLAAQVLCDQVASLQFRFLDQAGQALATPTALNVFAIEITVTLNSSGSGLTQRTRVELKNRYLA